MTDFTLPTLHLNGTGRNVLLAGYKDAYHCICTAHAAFSVIEFNARDYYVQGPDAYTRARTERYRMCNLFHELKHYLETHLAHLTSD